MENYSVELIFAITFKFSGNKHYISSFDFEQLN